MGVAEDITRILKESLTPEHLEVINESHLHAGHAGDDGSGESHFKVIITSEAFENFSRIECHRVIYSLLDSHLENMPHALSIKANG